MSNESAARLISRFAKGIQIMNGDRIAWSKDGQALSALPDIGAGDLAHVLIGTSASRGYWPPRLLADCLLLPAFLRATRRSGAMWCASVLDIGATVVRS